MALMMLDDVQAGEVLVEDVVDKQARILLKQGVELSDKHIRMLKSWGVAHVMVQTDAEEDADMVEYPENTLIEAQQHADAFFTNSNVEHPVIAFLQKVWLEQHLKELVK